jgi:NADH-quinone oxidoreductase subunit L
VHRTGFASWLAPVFVHTLYQAHQSTGVGISLAVVDAVVAVVGLTAGFVFWRRRVDRPALEPAFLQRVWYWDDLYDTVIGRPGQVLARFAATVVDGRIIDGAVNGAASVVRRSASGVRRLQTGYVRNYALGIALGLAAVIAFIISRVWWS